MDIFINMTNIPTVNHLLQKHGVLKQFRISKVVSKKDVLELKKKLGITSDSIDIQAKLEHTLHILSQMDYAAGNIPGIIVKHNPLDTNQTHIRHDIKRLLMISQLIGNILLEEKLNPTECQFILRKVIQDLNLNNKLQNDTDCL